MVKDTEGVEVTATARLQGHIMSITSGSTAVIPTQMMYLESLILKQLNQVLRDLSSSVLARLILWHVFSHGPDNE